ncbi:MAG: sugar transferase [Clostridia bacterium]|nr:sugar transferase [Clostridia bacterium]
MEWLFTEWWGILLFVTAVLLVWVLLSALLYRGFFKRFYDMLLSFLALVLLSPVLLVLIVLGAIKMKGNPFFTQARPGKNGKIFRLIKFRTMTSERDEEGNLLPDERRLTKYGKLLRATSLDELPEILNIFLGSMSIVGPRPLLVKYLPLYNERQSRRHEVRPGLTGLAQVSGRNALTWEAKFELDVNYVESVSLFKDIKILFMTVFKVFKREGINSDTSVTMEEFRGTPAEEGEIAV